MFKGKASTNPYLGDNLLSSLHSIIVSEAMETHLLLHLFNVCGE